MRGQRHMTLLRGSHGDSSLLLPLRVLPCVAALAPLRNLSSYSTFELASGRARRAKGKGKGPGGEEDYSGAVRAEEGGGGGDTAPKRAGGVRVRGAAGASTTSSSSSSSASANAAAAVGLGGSKRPLMSSVQARKEAERIFPTTSKSGRPEQHNTVAQQQYMRDPRRAAEVAEQLARDKEYARQMRAMHGGKAASAGPDRRFFSAFSDYTQIRDGDPYAGIFGESRQTERLRTAAWQRQFEKENEDVELPYERTNVIARVAPNWFVRYFVNMRDSGGSDSLQFVYLSFSAAVFGILLVYYVFYTAPKNAKPISEYQLALPCQLSRSEVEAVVALPLRLLLSEGAEGGGEAETTGAGAAPSVSGVGARRALLLGSHVRGLAGGVFVAVRITQRHKVETLLLGNKYFMSLQARGAGGSNSSNNNSEEKNVRVGRLVSLLLKPGKEGEAAELARRLQPPAASATDMPAPPEDLAAYLSLWLAAVHVGESTELFPLKSLVDAPSAEDDGGHAPLFGEEELQVYTQSAAAAPGVAAAGSLAALTGTLGGAQAAELQQRLRELRAVCADCRTRVTPGPSLRALLLSAAEADGGEGGVANAKPTAAAAIGTKRGRAEAQATDELEALAGAAPDGRVRRLEGALAGLREQAEQLRALLAARERAALEETRRRADEERRRAAQEERRAAEEAEERAARQQLADRLAETQRKLKQRDEDVGKVGQAARKYKEAVDRLRAELGLAAGGRSGAPAALTPDILEQMIKTIQHLKKSANA